MGLTRERMLERFLARDPSSLGRFLVGVVTTGIFCLPTCAARKPRPENVRFFRDEDEARRAGLRPCKRCRPDRFDPERDPQRDALEGLVDRVRRAPGDFPDVGSLARAAGMGVTKLKRSFREHYHTTPLALLQRARIAHACRALIGTRRRILGVALDAGFEGLSAFHANFRRRAGMSPGDYRAMGATGAFALGLPRGFRLEDLLHSLGRDPRSRTERVRGAGLVRTIRLAGGPASLSFDFGSGAARCTVEARRRLRGTELGEAHATALRLLGLEADPSAFERRMKGVPEARDLVEGREGLRIPLTPSVYEGLVWTIVGQQVNLGFAFTCRNALIDLAGTPNGDDLLAHPTPEAVARLDYSDLTRLRFSRRKAEYLIDASRGIAEGRLPLEDLPGRPATSVEETLLGVRGLGVWSTQYLLMRSCGFADCVPVGDAGLVRALEGFYGLDHRPGPEETRTLMEPFAPYRSLATFHLWKRLGDPA